MIDPIDRLIARASDEFLARFHTSAPTAFGIAPGRVELLGNHTDYNGGLVISAAIDRFTVIVGRPIGERFARVHSLNLDAAGQFPLDSLVPDPSSSWLNYIKGVLWAIGNAIGSPLTIGFDAVIVGNVPGRRGAFQFGQPPG